MLKKITRNVLCTLLLSVAAVSTANAQKLDGLFAPMPAGQTMQTTTQSIQVTGDWYREFPQEDGTTLGIGYRFEADGRLVAAFKTIGQDGQADTERYSGRYSVNGNKLNINFDDGSTIEFDVAVQNNLLTLGHGSDAVQLDRNGGQQNAAAPQVTPRNNITPGGLQSTVQQNAAPQDVPVGLHNVAGAWGLEHDMGNGRSLRMALAFDGHSRLSLGTAVFENGTAVEREDLNGTYELDGTRIIANWEDGTSELATYTIQGNTLVLNIEGQVFNFTSLN